MSNQPMRNKTRVIHAGLPPATQGTPFLPGPVFAASFHAAGDPHTSPFTYGRFHNPTWTQFENALSELEGGATVIFASGMAAIAAVFGSVLRPGDTVVMPSDSYYTARMLTDGYFTQMGIQVRQAPTTENQQAQVLNGAKLLWIESPTNPGLEVCDIPTLIQQAHQAGVLVAVDNTTPTILGQRPLDFGADFSVASDTKALTGHSDLILGHVAVREETWRTQLQTWRTQMGAIPGSMEVWLAHRSLATLDVRLERQCQNALKIAEFLSNHGQVQTVRYPGLPTDPSYAIASRQMQYYGPVVSFTLGNQTQAEQFLSACRLVIEATSFGGVTTTAERRARWAGDIVPEGFIRMSVGCEDSEDLIVDLQEALDAINK